MRGNIQRLADAECEALDREYEEQRVAFDNTVVAFTLYLGEMDSTIAKITSSISLYNVEAEEKGKWMAENRVCLQVASTHLDDLIRQRDDFCSCSGYRNRTSSQFIATFVARKHETLGHEKSD
ncbi:hypothetical protein M6B38_316385 [Iris pallida]|uniref:Uncharacterized protein n=1 Tax=Iris pallida TaxID=29817 RepID=A0AAX6HDJ4_IRIPA|nr:hypothetical protein M6B38_316385 [Iris pallida]